MHETNIEKKLDMRRMLAKRKREREQKKGFKEIYEW
jgi:hypothetical protein